MITKFENLKIKDHVFDRWFPWRIGKIVKKTKRTLTIWFFSAEDSWKKTNNNGKVVYDKLHSQFLEKI